MQKRVGAGRVAWAQGQKRSGDEAASRVGVEGQYAGQRTLTGLGRHCLTQIST